MRYIALITVVVALSVAFSSTARAACANAPTLYVQSDVLLARAAPSRDAEVIDRFAINAPLTPTGCPDENGFVQVRPARAAQEVANLNTGENENTRPAAPTVWVARRFLGTRTVIEEDVQFTLAAAFAVEDGDEAVKWAERLTALIGRTPEALNRTARAAALAGDEARVERMHLEAESGRTLLAVCDGRAQLLGELYRDGRFVPAVMTYEEMPEDSTEAKRERARLQRLRNEAAVRPFFAPGYDKRRGPPVRFDAPQLLGLEAGAVSSEEDLTAGLKVSLGDCGNRRGLVATEVFDSAVWGRYAHSIASTTAVAPKIAARLLHKVDDERKRAVFGVHLAAVPPMTLNDAVVHFERAFTVLNTGRGEPAAATIWSLHDGRGSDVMRFEFQSEARAAQGQWIRANENAMLRVLPWGDPGQWGTNLVIIDADGTPRRYEIPTVVASGC